MAGGDAQGALGTAGATGRAGLAAVLLAPHGTPTLCPKRRLPPAAGRGATRRRPGIQTRRVSRIDCTNGLHGPSRPAAPRIEHAFRNRELPSFDVPIQVQATQKYLAARTRNERTKISADSRTLKREKNSMRSSSVAGRLQPMRARQPTPFSRATSEDCGIPPGARRPARNSHPAARMRTVTRAHLESERKGPTRACHAPKIDTISCTCNADSIIF